MTPPEHTLRDDRPAREWLEALPLGNGVLGAMVFGGTDRHRYQINDGTAWSGSPQSEQIDPLDPGETARVLAETRDRLAERDYAGAEEVVRGLQHRHSQAYLPYGDLTLTVTHPEEAADYHRQLQLHSATHLESYLIGEEAVNWHSFVSRDAGVLVIRMETTHPAGLDVRADLSSPLRVIDSTIAAGGISRQLQLPADVYPKHDREQVTYDDDPRAALRGALVLRWDHDGQNVDLSGDDQEIAATGVRTLTVCLATQTTFAGFGSDPVGDSAAAERVAEAHLDAALAKGYGPLLGEHVKAHLALFGAASLRIGADVVEESADRPPEPQTDRRPSHVRLLEANRHLDGALAADPGLAELLFNYGRYLLISSSRPGGVPANLQGLWNDQLPAPWSSNYTININLEMNYWAAEATGLAECLEPLFGLVDALQVTGSRTARDLYAADGWAAHHNTDIWGYSRPVGHGRAQNKWAIWPMAGFWLVQHLWDHVQFGADDAFVRERAWPAIRGAVAFGLDWLIEGPDGMLGTSPSTSPENSFTVDGARYDVGVSSTMDLTLLRETFGYLLHLAERLEITDDTIVARAAEALPLIPRPSTGRGGQIREWLADDDQTEPHHRHLSHLYFLYPGSTEITPELEAGARASLDARGDESTGWSLAWKLALRARLRQPDKVSDLLRLVFRDMTTDRGGQSGGLYANFFAAHPPYQIDGNFGFVAGLVEALLQSHRPGEIQLLPALPPELPDGEVRGLRARGGVTVSMRWAGGVPATVELTARDAQEVRLRWDDQHRDVTLASGEPTVLSLTPDA